MAYSVEIAPLAWRQMKKLDKRNLAIIKREIDNLQLNPRPFGIKKLKNYNLYRLRVWDYRIIYSIDDGKLIILVLQVGHRRDI